MTERKLKVTAVARPRILITTLLVLISVASLPVGAKSLCDPKLQGEVDRATGYRDRPRPVERCEGFYVSQVKAGGRLQLVGLHYGELRFDATDDSVALTPVIGDKAVHLRAVGMPAKTYYRLDARVPARLGSAPAASFEWPLNVVRRGGLRARDIGLLGYLADDPKTFVPVLLPGSDSELKMKLRANRSVARLWWRRAPAPGGKCGKMGDWTQVSLVNAVSGQNPLTIDLFNLPPGTQCIEVQARSTSGEPLEGDWKLMTGR